MDMHNLRHLLDEALMISIDELECEVDEAKSCHRHEHEIHEAVDTIKDIICIKRYCGWLNVANPHHEMHSMPY